jgi:hypothetical protein
LSASLWDHWGVERLVQHFALVAQQSNLTTSICWMTILSSRTYNSSIYNRKFHILICLFILRLIQTPVRLVRSWPLLANATAMMVKDEVDSVFHHGFSMADEMDNKEEDPE